MFIPIKQTGLFDYIFALSSWYGLTETNTPSGLMMVVDGCMMRHSINIRTRCNIFYQLKLHIEFSALNDDINATWGRDIHGQNKREK